jgi:hypothetical protein
VAAGTPPTLFGPGAPGGDASGVKVAADEAKKQTPIQQQMLDALKVLALAAQQNVRARSSIRDNPHRARTKTKTNNVPVIAIETWKGPSLTRGLNDGGWRAQRLFNVIGAATQTAAINAVEAPGRRARVAAPRQPADHLRCPELRQTG